METAVKYVKLYRVQHSISGVGPYHESNVHDDISMEFDRAHNDLDSHPTPYAESEGGVFMYGDRHSAFGSLAQYKQWFNSQERNIMANNGFQLLELEVPEHDVVKILPKQAVFKRTMETKIVKVLPCHEV